MLLEDNMVSRTHLSHCPRFLVYAFLGQLQTKRYFLDHNLCRRIDMIKKMAEKAKNINKMEVEYQQRCQFMKVYVDSK